MSLLPTLDKTKSIFNINMLTYAQRAEYAHHPLAKRLFMLMEQKQTNLIHNPDVDNKKQFIALTDAIGPYICALKTHIDIINDFDWDLIEQLKTLAQKHNFLIIEDRKFCDIGSIVQKQYRDGMYKIVDWADIIIAHAVSGPGVVDGLKSVGKDKNRGMLLLSHLSCAGNLIDNMYTKKTVELAETNTDFVVGLVAQERCTTDIGLLIVAPGISLTQKKDNLSQRYNTPEYMIGQCGIDAIIVGRSIYNADDLVDSAQQYRGAGWQAYKKRIES